MLADRQMHYAQTGESLRPTPARYKKEYAFLKEVDSLALANEQLNLERAYRNFFEGRSHFPKFKKKGRGRDSYTTNLVTGKPSKKTGRPTRNIRIEENGIVLPKLGRVKAVIHREAPEDWRLKSVTVTREKDGTCYAAVLYEYDRAVEPLTEISTHIGLDYKSNGLYVDSNGVCADMPRFFRASEKKLARAQRRLSRKQNGSKNYGKQRRKVAKIHRRAANQRKDTLEKLSTEIANRYELVSVEDLDMRAVSRSLKLGKSTLDNGYGYFLTRLAQKQELRGHYLLRVGKSFPSSQLCSCGYRNPVTKDLSVRTLTCPVCGRVYDRDINAAQNIDMEGLRIWREAADAA